MKKLIYILIGLLLYFVCDYFNASDWVMWIDIVIVMIVLICIIMHLLKIKDVLKQIKQKQDDKTKTFR